MDSSQINDIRSSLKFTQVSEKNIGNIYIHQQISCCYLHERLFNVNVFNGLSLVNWLLVYCKTVRKRLETCGMVFNWAIDLFLSLFKEILITTFCPRELTARSNMTTINDLVWHLAFTYLNTHTLITQCRCQTLSWHFNPTI